MMRAIFAGNKPTESMTSSIMVFGAKPKKPGSILPKDKRKISLLNADVKLATGIEARRINATPGHTPSPAGGGEQTSTSRHQERRETRDAAFWMLIRWQLLIGSVWTRCIVYSRKRG